MDANQPRSVEWATKPTRWCRHRHRRHEGSYAKARTKRRSRRGEDDHAMGPGIGGTGRLAPDLRLRPRRFPGRWASSGAASPGNRRLRREGPGDSVEFTNRRGQTVKATCQERNGRLVPCPRAASEAGAARGYASREWRRGLSPGSLGSCRVRDMARRRVGPGLGLVILAGLIALARCSGEEFVDGRPLTNWQADLESSSPDPRPLVRALLRKLCGSSGPSEMGGA
jgi:hypothetical protein